MRFRFLATLLGAALLSITPSCGGGGGGSSPTPEVDPPALGEPIDGLTVAEQAAFDRGRRLFQKQFKPSEGLGPLYNATSCASCHSTPTVGGSSKLYRNFYLARYGDPTSPATQFDLPDLPSAVIPAFGSRGPIDGKQFSLQGGRTLIPHDMFGGFETQVAQRNAPPIFGVGLFEFVPIENLMARSDPNDTKDPVGISGRFNEDNAGAFGVLGYKSQSPGVVEFTRPPLLTQMGITSDPLVPTAMNQQVSGNPGDAFEDDDGVPDPEISNTDLNDLVAFVRFLAPPAPRPFNAAARRGEALFDSVGCVACHVPSLPSSRGPLNAYTDLLIHDMGDALADHLSLGVPQPSLIDDLSSHREWRTAPLWGVSHHAPFLHDGRAATLLESITMHADDGDSRESEAKAVTDAFLALTPAERADIIAFLEHL